MYSFTGKFLYSIDQKGRLNLPFKFRRMTKTDNFVLTYGLEKCLFIFPEERWLQYVKGCMPLTIGEKAHRDFLRLFGSSTEDLSLDKQGRLQIREDFLEHAGLKKEALIIGVIDHIEVWDPACWEEYKKSIANTYPQLAEQAMRNVNLTEYIE